MKLYKATDEIAVDCPTVTIVSDPGVGKSTLGNGAEKGLTLDADLGAHRAKNRRDTARPETWRDIEELIGGGQDAYLKESFGKTFADYSTVVVDTAGAALDFLTLDIIEKNSKHGAAGSLSQQGWGVLKTRFGGFKSTLVAQRKNLVFLCHAKEEKSGDRLIVRPAVQGGSLAILLASSDVIGYMHMEGKQRVIEWNPSETWIAKSPGWPTQKVPDYAADPDFLAKIQQRARLDLGKMSADSAIAANQVASFLEGIACAASLDDLNTLVANSDALPTIVKAQIRTPLAEKVKEMGAIYDKKAKVYVPKAAEVAAVA